jgi:hypothetical protein
MTEAQWLTRTQSLIETLVVLVLLSACCLAPGVSSCESHVTGACLDACGDRGVESVTPISCTCGGRP